MGGWENATVLCICHYESQITFLVVVDKMERMESGYLCEVLHFLLRGRFGTPFLKISVDLVDVDNEASLDLLCALFKHCECY